MTRDNLAQWLERIERLHPSEIDLGLARVGEVWQALRDQTSEPPESPSRPLVFTVGGTNGKGSVCAMLESIGLAAGYRVGKYTSPHIVVFNERVRINGVEASDDDVIGAFESVERARGDISLTYYEFTTLAILYLLFNADLDMVILEVGLGGRLDAVNLVDADCAILTCVALDHQNYLGDTRESIGWEKAHIFRAEKPAICADPQPPASVATHASGVGADLWQFGRDFNYAGDRQQWSYAGRTMRRNALAYPALRGANQLLNATAVLAAFEAVRDRLPVTQQDVRQGFARVTLRGRFEILPGQPTVVLDAAHNPHAAAHLAANLDNMGFFPYTLAVFGVMADKDIDGILKAMGSRVDHWYLVDLPLARAASASDLQRRLLALNVPSGPDQSVTCCKDPADALARAKDQAGENDRIVVFGSFHVLAGTLASPVEPGS